MKLAEQYARVHARLASRAADPLRYWHFAVPRMRDAFGLFAHPRAPISELYARGANGTGKTLTNAAYVLACLQKRREFDGVALPQWRGKVEGVFLSLDYKAQKLSVQPAILKLLGKWPHHARYTGDVLSTVAIMPVNGSSDESEWSTLTLLSEENKRAGVGVRADVVAFDEPPEIEILRELRKAAHAGRRGIRVIGATPTIRRQWAPLKDEYGDSPRSSLRRVGPDWAEVRWSLDEVADWVLSPAEKDKLKREYGRDRKRRDPLYDARVFGDYIDASGSCPFDIDTLLAMLDECVDPELVEWPVSAEEGGEEAESRVARRVTVEVYAKPRKSRSYYVTIDPSSGTDDGLHDPYEIEIAELGSGDLVARCGGYLSGRTVGILAAGLARQYHDALIDVEVNDRWGVNVVEGCYAASYANFARERRELRPGEWSNEIGFHNTAQSRPVIIGSIQAWIEARRAGIRYAECRSRFVLQSLLDCILDETGKIVAAPGLHDEPLICWGQMLRKAVTRSGRLMPELYARERTPDEVLAALIRGEGEEEESDAPFGQVWKPARERPRI